MSQAQINLTLPSSRFGLGTYSFIPTGAALILVNYVDPFGDILPTTYSLSLSGTTEVSLAALLGSAFSLNYSVLSMTVSSSSVSLGFNGLKDGTVASGNPLYINLSPGNYYIGGKWPGGNPVYLIDGSGTIATGGSAQTIFTMNPSRKYLFIQNNSAASLWVNFTTTATQSQPSMQLTAGASLAFQNGYVTTEAVSIIGASSGQAYTAKQG